MVDQHSPDSDDDDEIFHPSPEAAATASMAPLTADEKVRYTELDQRVVKGLQSFADEVADALLEIKNKNLWRAEFKNWGAYCTARLEMSRSHADRLAGFAAWRGKFKKAQAEGKVKKDIEPPRSEGALRPLMSIPDFDQQVDLYESLYDEGKAPPTRKVAAEAVKKIMPREETTLAAALKAADSVPVVTAPEKPVKVRRQELIYQLYEALDNAESEHNIKLPDVRRLITELNRLPEF